MKTNKEEQIRQAEYIRRGYDLEVYDRAVENLHKIGINVVTHIIIGLPNETKKDMLQSVEYVCRVTDGIKLQLLHILKDTDLEREYENGKLDVMSMEEYIAALEECVRQLPPQITIHRLTGDGDKKYLVAPLWSADKKRVLNEVNAAFRRDNVIQGEHYEV